MWFMTANMLLNSTGIRQIDGFVEQISATLEAGKGDEWVVGQVSSELRRLLQKQNWLPEAYCKPQPGCPYSQYPLYVDPAERFCVTAVAFGPSVSTPIHNHTVWGVIGVYRGIECERRYLRQEQADSTGEAEITEVGCGTFGPGEVSGFTAPDKDIHSIETTPLGSVSIHIYGANIAKVARLNFDRTTGRASVIYSCYSEVSAQK